jgi:uncharacterized membrane protein YobD (UPF0266 family)
MRSRKTICWMLIAVVFVLLLAVNVDRNQTTTTELALISLSLASIFMAFISKDKEVVK